MPCPSRPAPVDLHTARVVVAQASLFGRALDGAGHATGDAPGDHQRAERVSLLTREGILSPGAYGPVDVRDRRAAAKDPAR